LINNPTKIDYLSEIIDILQELELADGEFHFTIDELIEFCDNEIELLTKKSNKAKRVREARKENYSDDLLVAIQEVLKDDMPRTIYEIGEELANNDEATIGKIVYRLTLLVNNGKAEKINNKYRRKKE